MRADVASPDALRLRLRRIGRWAGGRWAFYVNDLRAPDGAALGIGERESFPSASVIKLPILLRVLERVGRGEVSLDDPVTLTAWHKTGGAGVFQHFRDGTVFRLEDACTAMTVLSDNTATNLVIDVAGIEGTNRFLEAAGCERTRLHRYFGKPEMAGWGGAAGPSQAVPLEMGRLLEGLALGALPGLTPELCRRALLFLRRQQHRALAPRFLPEGTVMAHKTGSLDGLRHDVGLLWMPEEGRGAETGDVMALPSTELPRARPVVFVAMSQGVPDLRWTVENRAEVAIGRAARAVYDALS